MKRKKTTAAPVVGPSGSRRAKPSLTVNKVRRVFTRRKPAGRTASSVSEAGGARANVSGQPATHSRARPIKKPLKTLIKKATAAGSRKGASAGGKQVESSPDLLEPTALAQEKKVYRALKLLHIDFKESKERSTSLTRNVTRRSIGLSTPPAPTDTQGSSTGVTSTASDSPSSSSAPTVTAGRKKNSNAGLQEGAPAEEPTDASKSSPVQTEPGVRGTTDSSGGSGPGTAAQSDDTGPGASSSRLKKGVTRSKPGLALKPALESTTENMPGTKAVRAPAARASPSAAADVGFMVPKTSKRFSTSIYSSRRKTSAGVDAQRSESAPEPMEVGEDSEVKKDSSLPKVSQGTASAADSFQTAGQSKNTSPPQDAATVRRGKGSRSVAGRGAVRGFQRGAMRVRGSFRGRAMTKTSRGRGFAMAALSSRVTAAEAHRGRGSKRTRWTHHKNSKSDLHSPHTASEVETLSEPEEDTNATPEEPPAKRGRFKKGQTNVDAEEDPDQTPAAAGETKDTAGAEFMQTKNKANTQPLVSAKSAEEAAAKGKMPTPKALKTKAAGKVGSRSVEQAVRGRSWFVGQVRSATSSRSSSPGGTEVRPRGRKGPPAGELSRSSSLDNLLYRTSAPKQTRSRTSLGRGGDHAGNRSEGKSSDKTATPKSEAGVGDSGATPLTSKDAAGPSKRKLSPRSSSAERQKGLSSAAKKRRLLTRLEDSSTHQVPNILLSCRSSRLSALGDSPAISRESSPGTAPSVPRKKSLERADALMDTEVVTVDSAMTPARVVKGRGKGRRKQLVKGAVEDSGGSRCVGEEDMPSSSTYPKIEGAKRPRGRPKGASNRKFRFNVLKNHSKAARENIKAYKMQFGSSLKSPIKIRADLSRKRGPGRPKKNSEEKDWNQHPAGQSSKNSNANKPPASVSSSTTESTPALKKGKQPLKYGRLKEDLKSVSVTGATKTSAVVKKKGRPKKELSKVKPSADSGQNAQDMVLVETSDFSLGDHSYSCDNISGARKATTSSDADCEKGSAASSDMTQQSSCGDLDNKSKDSTMDGSLSSAGSSAAEEQVVERAGRRQQKPCRLSQRNTSSQSSTLRSLVRMRRESRRNMKKSQWAASRSPKQYQAAVDSTVQWKPQSSALSSDALPSTSGSLEQSVTESQPPSSSQSAGPSGSGDSEMETSVVEESQDPTADIPSTSPGTACGDQPSGDASVEAAVPSDPSESTASLAEPSVTGQSQAPDTPIEPPANGQSQAPDTPTEPSANEQSQAPDTPTEPSANGQSQAPDTPTEPSANGQSQAPDTPTEPSANGQSQAPDTPTEPSANGQSQAPDTPTEPSANGQSQAPDTPTEPSANGQSQAPDTPTEPSANGQSQAPDTPTEPSANGQSQAPDTPTDSLADSHSQDQPVASGDELYQFQNEAAQSSALEPESQPVCESLSTPEPAHENQAEGDLDLDPANKLGPISEPDPLKIPDQSNISDPASDPDPSNDSDPTNDADPASDPDPAKLSTVLGSHSADVVLPPCEPSASDDCEDQPAATGESSTHCQSEDSSVHSGSEGTSKQEIKEPSKHGEAESSMNEMEQSQNSSMQEAEEPMHSEAEEQSQEEAGMVSDISPGSGLPMADESQMKPVASAESDCGPKNASDVICSSDPPVEDLSDSTADTKADCDQTQAAEVRPDTCKQTDAEDVPHTCAEENPGTGTESHQAQPACEEPLRSHLPATGQPAEVKLNTAEGVVTEGPSQGVGQPVPNTESSSPTTADACDTKPHLTSTEGTEESSPSVSTLLQLQNVVEPSEKLDQQDLLDKSESEFVQDIPKSSHAISNSPKNTKTETQDPERAGQPVTEEQDIQSPSEDGDSADAERKIPISKRKQVAISRELKRLQTDEGAQRIMSWHEKKKLKSMGKLLRSKIKDSKEDTKWNEDTREQKPKKSRSNKLYSIDTLSDTRLVFKSGKSSRAVSEEKQKLEKASDRGGSLDRESSSGLVVQEKTWRRGVLSVSSSMDSEDGGAPPDITETPPYKDSRWERGRSEELSPPPLIRPEDLFSGAYYESMSVSPADQCAGTKTAMSEGAARGAERPSLAQVSATDINTSLENETSGAFSGVFVSGAPKVGSGRRRGRGKRRYKKMGPASKTGRALNVKPGPASSKIGRRTSSPKHDPSYVRNMPHLPSEPRTFALRPKTTRSPIEIIAMKQKLEEEAYELEEATRVARKLKRRQAQYGRLAMESESSNQNVEGSCKPCSVVLVDFVKELHLNSIDTSSDQYISDVSYDSDEEDVDDEDDDYADDLYTCHPDDESLDTSRPDLLVLAQMNRDVEAQDDQEAVQDQSATFTLQKVSGIKPSESSPAERKSPPDLDSLRGKGFMGNFVDFIQNRDSQALTPSSKRQPQFRSRTPPVLSEQPALQVSQGCVVNASSDSVLTAPCLTTMSTSSSSLVSVPSHSRMVTSAQIHTPRLDHHAVCPEDKTVRSSPSRLDECSKPVNMDKTSYSPHHHALVKSAVEKSGVPGKLKVFPARKESEGAAADKTAFTRYLCTKCEFSATNKGTMESHIYRHIPGVTFTCGYCTSEFTGLISALTHVKNSHNSKEPKVWISKDINEASLYTEEEIPSPHSCQQEAGPAECGDGDKAALHDRPPVIISLVVSGGGERGVQRGERFSSSPLATQRRFACTHCSYCTNVVEDAHQHVRDLHSHSSLFTCYLCDKAFGCSLQYVAAHCRATHPDRPQSYKKLPDFYDQELIRMNSGSTDRSKPSEDRGNIFDRMSNLFPGLGPGGELLEDGQLSPQARFLRARDYLYIQEGWSKKTSAEADSTTMEDIEVPFEDGADADSLGLDSTTNFQPQLGGAKDSALSSLAGAENRTDTAGLSKHGAGAEHLHSSEQTVVPQDNQHSSDQSAVGSHYMDGECSPKLPFKVTPGTTKSMSSASSELDKSCTSLGQDTVTEAGLASTRESIADDSGDGTQSNAAERLSACDRSSMTELPGASGDHVSEKGKPTRTPAKSSSAEQGEGGSPRLAGAGQCPALGESNDLDDDDDDGPEVDDGETDILVIDLGDDEIEDIADDDASHCSSPREETERSLPEADARAAEEKEAATRAAQGQEGSGSRAERSEASSGDGESSAAGCEGSEEGGGDDSVGIKILSVVSLRDKPTNLSISPAKSHTGSEHDPTTPPSSGKKRASLAGMSPKSGPRGKSSATSRPQLPEVDADEMALRNERMVCTYKCHTCSIHSPALSCIVEHLKQQHHDMPLFSCPYCKARKESFFTEESVHTHVIQHHPLNYAKNEVSLSEVAKSFVQVLALPSGHRVRGSLIEEDIYMCLKCESHVPDLDYALRHLKYEHPGLLKYACPLCGTFSHSLQEVVKRHMVETHGQLPDSMRLAMAMEGVYLTKVTCISVGGQYVEHDPPSTPRSPHTSTPPSTSSHGGVTGAPHMGTAGSASLVSPSAGGSGPGVLPVPSSQVSPQALAAMQELTAAASSASKSGRHRAKIASQQQASSSPLRPILPMPGTSSASAHSPRGLVEGGGLPQFQITGVTVKDILDTRQKTGDPGMVPVSLGASSTPSGQLPGDSVPLRETVTDRLGGSVSPRAASHSVPRASSTFTPPTSRPVLRVPNVSSVLDLTTPSRCSSVDTGTSVNTLTGAEVSLTRGGALACPASVAAALSLASRQMAVAASLPYSVAALTAVSSALSVPASPRDREDPEAFKIFNLKPRIPLPLPPRPATSGPLVSAHTSLSSSSLLPLASPLRSSAPATNLAPGTVTVASSALFPQQFRLQSFPPLQPASIATLPLGQGGLPLAQNFALPIGAGLPLTIPINVTQTQLLMAAPNTFPPVLVPANLLPQMGLRGPVPQIPMVSAPPAPPPAHQALTKVQTAPVNLSLTQPTGHPGVLVSEGPRPKPSRASPSSFQPNLGLSRGRGRPRLNKAVETGFQPRFPGGSSTPCPSLPTPLHPPSPEVSRPASTPAARPFEPPVPSPKAVRQGATTCHQCVCPYCIDTIILKPWEVAQHIKVLHPGKEVKYNRV